MLSLVNLKVIICAYMNLKVIARTCVNVKVITVRAPVFGRHQFFGTSEHFGKAHGSLLSGWMNYNYTACCWFPTSSNILILPAQFWQIGFESYWLHCSKCRILVLLRYLSSIQVRRHKCGERAGEVVRHRRHVGRYRRLLWYDSWRHGLHVDQLWRTEGTIHPPLQRDQRFSGNILLPLSLFFSLCFFFLFYFFSVHPHKIR